MLVVVLVTLLFASLLLTRLIEAGSADLLLAMRQADRARLQADAHSALETTLAVLMDFRTVDGGLYASSQGWDDPLGYAGYTPREGVAVQVGFEDESAKLSLPRLTPDTLNTLLVQLGLAAPDAARVTDAMFVWMHRGHLAAESETSARVYEQDELPAVPPGRPLRSFDELAGIEVARGYFYDPAGRPRPLLEDFRRVVSLYEFNGTNLNMAAPAVLRAAGWEADQIGRLEKYLARPVIATRSRPYLRSPQEVHGQLGKVSLNNLGEQSHLLRINVTVRRGPAALHLSALVTWLDLARLPTPFAASPEGTTRVVGEQASAQSASPALNASANSLRYPFTVLEFSETVLPATTDAPAA